MPDIVQEQRLPHSLFRGAESPPRQIRSKNYDRLIPGTPIGVRKSAAIGWNNAEHREQTGRHIASGEAFTIIIAAGIHGEAAVTLERFKKAGLLPPQDGLRREIRATAAARTNGTDDRSETVGMRIRNGAKQRFIDDGEDGRRRSDAERERQDSAGSESGVPPDDAQAISKISEKRLDPGPRSRVPHALLDLIDAAEVEHRGATRRVGSHSPAAILIGDEIDVRVNFFVQILFDTPTANDVPPDGREPVKKRHVTYASRARAIAAAIRFHCAFSSPSCRSPGLVRR